jgi:hypothetical protein
MNTYSWTLSAERTFFGELILIKAISFLLIIMLESK